MGDLKVLTCGYMGGFEESTKLLLETSTLDHVGCMQIYRKPSKYIATDK